MSGERTEKPTPKRRQEARKKGQVARSSDVNSAAVLLGSLLALMFGGAKMFHALEGTMTSGIARAGSPSGAASGGVDSMAWWAFRSFFSAAAPVMIAAAAAGVLANVVQVRPHLSPVGLKPSFSKLNPGPGLQRMFGKQGAVEAGK